ncbi:MAG: glycoside hydrolase family 28 protein, partial [Planctomycetes bacterium]|nr:glycoside hydrolase family 28 protein [Planctomycetota bacterium]
MYKSILRKRSAVARNTAFTVLTLALILGCVHSVYAAEAKTGWDLLPEILSRIVPPTFRNEDFIITNYGAVGDGVTDCNPAFKKAIAGCTKAGGGRVVVPRNGTFLTNGPIHLDNNVNLHISEGATIKFGTNFDDFLPHVFVRWEGTECYSYSPLIYA